MRATFVICMYRNASPPLRMMYEWNAISASINYPAAPSTMARWCGGQQVRYASSKGPVRHAASMRQCVQGRRIRTRPNQRRFTSSSLTLSALHDGVWRNQPSRTARIDQIRAIKPPPLSHIMQEWGCVNRAKREAQKAGMHGISLLVQSVPRPGRRGSTHSPSWEVKKLIWNVQS